MKNGTAVLVDTCVVIGASYPNEVFHKKCKSLFDYFSQNPVGVITNYVKGSAEKNVCSKYGADNLDALEANISLLRMEPISHRDLEVAFSKARRFYADLPRMIESHIRKSEREKREMSIYHWRRIPRKLRSSVVMNIHRENARREFPSSLAAVQNVLLDKTNSVLNSDDTVILADACCLKKVFGNVFIASTDQHLSSVRLEDKGIAENFVPYLIKKEFGVTSDWPDIILKSLNPNNSKD